MNSRFEVVKFYMTKDDKKFMLKTLTERIVYILRQENVKIEDLKSIVQFISVNFPDIRHILKSLQQIGIRNAIVENNMVKQLKIPASLADEFNAYDVDKLKKLITEGSHQDIILYVESVSPDFLYNFIAENVTKLVSQDKVWDVLSTVNIFSYQESFTALKNINTAVCLRELKKLIV